MDNKSIALLLTTFIALIIGVGLLTTIASEEQGYTTLTGVSAEAIDVAPARDAGGGFNISVGFTIANPPTTWKITDCPVESFELKQYNGSVLTGSGTDYTFNTNNGTVVLVLTNAMEMDNLSNGTTADYRYCADDYLNLEWGRTMLNLVPGFFAIGLLFIAVGAFVGFLKREGIWGQSSM